MVDVFISYSRADQEKVGMLARMIASEGYQVWWDADLPPHMSYGDVITAKIGAAKAAVVVWSETAAKSEWVRAEADVARNQKKLIQTSLDEVMPPLPFNQIQCAEIGDWNGEADHRGWSKVKQSLVALCGPRGDAATGEVVTGADVELEPATTPSPSPEPPPPPQPTSAPPPSSSTPSSTKSVGKTASSGTSTPVLIALGCGGLAVLSVLLLAFGMMASTAEEYSNVAQTDDDVFVDDVYPDAYSGDSSGGNADGGALPQLDPVGPPSAPPASGGETIPIFATIEDPDGYTNVRAGPSTDYEVIGAVTQGEEFLTFQQSDAWWIVTLEDGTMGYIYSDRIRVTRVAQ